MSCDGDCVQQWLEALPCIEGLPFSSPSSPGLVSLVLWWGVAVSLGLALAISVALVTCYWRRKREKDPPRGLSLESVR